MTKVNFILGFVGVGKYRIFCTLSWHLIGKIITLLSLSKEYVYVNMAIGQNNVAFFVTN